MWFKNIWLKIQKSKLHRWFNGKVDFQNNKWYVWIALIASIVQIWTTVMVSQTRSDVKDIQNYIKWAYNEQTGISTIGLIWDDFIQKYFSALSSQDYNTACWFESKRRCDKDDIQKLIDYSEDKKRIWFTKWEDGEHIKNIWKPEKQPNNPSLETWCVKSNYIHKSENIPIEQIARYDLLTRPTGEKEIAWVLCEKTFKDWEDRTKPMGCGQSNICNQ